MECRHLPLISFRDIEYIVQYIQQSFSGHWTASRSSDGQRQPIGSGPRAITPRGAIPYVRGVLRFRSERRPVVCSRYRTSFLEKNTVAGILSTGSRRRETHLRRICCCFLQQFLRYFGYYSMTFILRLHK